MAAIANDAQITSTSDTAAKKNINPSCAHQGEIAKVSRAETLAISCKISVAYEPPAFEEPEQVRKRMIATI
jgi:hypothetical protein